MNEISSIRLENFQSHRDTILELAPAGQLTCIVGASDAGKTSILRALRWLYYNTPDGSDFIRVGANMASVTIDYADGHRVARQRGRRAGYNRYAIMDGMEDHQEINPQRFEGFGRGVPLEVQQLTGVRPIQIGDMTLNINLADQLSGPFLGSDISAPARAKVLGKLAGTEEIDQAARGAGTDLYRRRQDEKQLVDDAGRLEKAIGEYAYIEELGARIEQAETVQKRLQDNNEKLAVLLWHRQKLAQILTQLSEIYQKKMALDTTIALVESLVASAGQSLDLLARLQALSVRWNKTGALLWIEESVMERTASIMDAEILLSCGVKKLERYIGLDRRWAALTSLRLRLQTVQATLNATQRTEDASDLAAEIARNMARRNGLNVCRFTLGNVLGNLQTADCIVDATQRTEDTIILARMLQDDITLAGKLRSAATRRSGLAQNISLAGQTSERLAGLDDAGTLAKAIETKWEKQFNLIQARDRYLSHQETIETHSIAIKSWAEKEEAAKEEYRNILLATGVCPVCGSQITSENLKEAV